MNTLLVLDLLGTFAFASYGAYQALRKKYDLFGIAAIGFVTAVGGGTIRAMLVNELPSYFVDYRYVVAILLGVLFAIGLFKQFPKIEHFLLLLDSIGLVTFAYLGAVVAAEHHLGGFATLVLAVLTAVGGGVLRDILLNVKPEVLYRDVYASVALLVGLGVWLHWPLYGLLMLAFLLRLIVIYFKLNLWKPRV